MFFVISCGVLFAKYHPEIKWREICDDRFIVVFPRGCEDEAFYILDSAHEIYNKLQQLWGYPTTKTHSPKKKEINKSFSGGPGGRFFKKAPLVAEGKKKEIVRNKIRILLHDSYDFANGSATFFPFNWIELHLFDPAPESDIGSCRDWLFLVLSHEMNHIFNMNAGSGFTYFMRKIFGANPVFFPMIYAPVWLMEGTSIYAESKLNPGGRLDIPDFEIALGNILAAGQIPEAAQIYGEPTFGPGPNVKYLYGAKFVEFLAGRYGEEKVRKLVHSFGYHFVPLWMSTRFKRIFDKDLKTLWAEFVESIAGLQKDNKNKVKHLTRSGWGKKYPVCNGQGKVFYVDQNYKEFPGIHELDLDTGKTRRLIKKGGVNALFYSKEDKKLYFSAAEYYKSFYRYFDLYELDLKKNRLKRLTRGRRLSYPVKRGDKIYCVKRKGSKSYLTVYDLKTGKETIISRGFASLAQLALPPGGWHPQPMNADEMISSREKTFAKKQDLSPSEVQIAAALKNKNQHWRIALFTVGGAGAKLRLPASGAEQAGPMGFYPDSHSAGKPVKLLSRDGVKSYAPRWKNNREIFFITADQNSYRLASVDADTGDFYIYRDDSLPDVKYFSFLPGGEELVVSFFDTNGLNLGLLELQRADFTTKGTKVPLRGEGIKGASPDRQTGKNDSPAPEKAALPGKSRGRRIKKYNSLRELFPKYFAPNFRDAGEEIKPGLSLSGNDILEKHAFELDAFYGFESRKWSFGFNYTYDGFYPTLVFKYGNYSDLYKRPCGEDFIHFSENAEISARFPLSIKEKRQSYFYAAVYFEKIADRYSDPVENSSVHLGGFKAGYIFSSIKKYYDSISYADGAGFALSYARDLKFLGSDYDINTIAFDYRMYLSVSRPNVLAFRFGAADSWGEAQRLFHMGGADSEVGFTMAGGNMFDLMRGFPSGFFAGSGGFIVNLEYRVALFKIERVFTVIRSLDRVYLAFFADIGNLWLREKVIDPAYSLGLELNLTAYIGDLKFNFAGGGAVGQNPYHAPVFYFRIGNSF